MKRENLDQIVGNFKTTIKNEQKSNCALHILAILGSAQRMWSQNHAMHVIKKKWIEYSTGSYKEFTFMNFHWLGPLGRVSQRVAMSVCLSVCLSAPSDAVFYKASHWPWDYMISEVISAVSSKMWLWYITLIVLLKRL